jgi:hypothetical protein
LCGLGGALLYGAFVAGAPRAWALDRFEIQVYDGSADPPGTPGLELHANTVASGLRDAAPPELPPNHQTHLTLEPSLGLTGWWEIGGYLQSTLRPDGQLDYAGIKLRSKFVRPGLAFDRLRLGINLEVSAIPASYERDRFGAEVRPIVAFTASAGRLAFAVNPILDFALTNPVRAPPSSRRCPPSTSSPTCCPRVSSSTATSAPSPTRSP